jgi:hypothetical protein
VLRAASKIFFFSESQLRKCLLLAGAGAAACCEQELEHGGGQASHPQTGTQMSNFKSSEISTFIV